MDSHASSDRSDPMPVPPAGPTSGDDPAATPEAQPADLRAQLGTVVFDIGAPIALYYLLHSLGTSNLLALGIGALVPACGVVYQLVTRHRTDGVGLVVVVTVAATMIMSVVSGSPRFLLARDGLTTGMWSLWFFVSVRARRPAAYVLARPLMEGRRLLGTASWEALWVNEPQFRRIWRIASVMWGIALLADGAVRVVMAYTLPVNVVPALGGCLYLATLILVQIVTNIYYNRAGLYRLLGASWALRGRGHHGRPRLAER